MNKNLTINDIKDEFKVKALNISGEWCIGLLNFHKNNLYISNTLGVPYAFEIRPETVCRCIGMSDMHNTLVYINDVVYDPFKGRVHTVVCIEGRLGLRNDGGGIEYREDYKKFFSENKIIGNIFSGYIKEK